MKKWLVIAFSIIIFLIINIVFFTHVHHRKDFAEGLLNFSKAKPAIEMSPAMMRFLNRKCGSCVARGQNIKEWAALLCDITNNNPEDPFPLKIVIDSDVNATVVGIWTDLMYKQIIDNICNQNVLVWEITGPNTIRISNGHWFDKKK